MASKKGSSDTIIIKKYANRRLYDTSASAYVTLDHLSRLVREGKDFVVQDAKSGEDLTRTVLAQIIFEQENQQEGVLPISFLRQIIQFYGESFQSMLPTYLEMSMNSFAMQQEKWREYMEKSLQSETGGPSPFEAQIRRNIAVFEETMRMFASTGSTQATASPPEQSEPKPQPARPANDMASDDAIVTLQKQMADMQRKIEALAKNVDSDFATEDTAKS